MNSKVEQKPMLVKVFYRRHRCQWFKLHLFFWHYMKMEESHLKDPRWWLTSSFGWLLWSSTWSTKRHLILKASSRLSTLGMTIILMCWLQQKLIGGSSIDLDPSILVQWKGINCNGLYTYTVQGLNVHWTLSGTYCPVSVSLKIPPRFGHNSQSYKINCIIIKWFVFS